MNIEPGAYSQAKPGQQRLDSLQFILFTAVAVLLTAGIATPAASAQTFQEFAS